VTATVYDSTAGIGGEERKRQKSPDTYHSQAKLTHPTDQPSAPSAEGEGLIAPSQTLLAGPGLTRVAHGMCGLWCQEGGGMQARKRACSHGYSHARVLSRLQRSTAQSLLNLAPGNSAGPASSSAASACAHAGALDGQARPAPALAARGGVAVRAGESTAPDMRVGGKPSGGGPSSTVRPRVADLARAACPRAALPGASACAHEPTPQSRGPLTAQGMPGVCGDSNSGSGALLQCLVCQLPTHEACDQDYINSLRQMQVGVGGARCAGGVGGVLGSLVRVGGRACQGTGAALRDGRAGERAGWVRAAALCAGAGPGSGAHPYSRPCAKQTQGLGILYACPTCRGPAQSSAPIQQQSIARAEQLEHQLREGMATPKPRPGIDIFASELHRWGGWEGGQGYGYG